jgi:hypothetical protein
VLLAVASLLALVWVFSVSLSFVAVTARLRLFGAASGRRRQGTPSTDPRFLSLSLPGGVLERSFLPLSYSPRQTPFALIVGPHTPHWREFG